MIPKMDRKWSPKSTANDPQRKIGMACSQVSGWSCQFYYYYKKSDLKRTFTSQINTWIKTIWKKSFKCKQATHVLPECCLFQWIFSPVGRLCSGGKRFGWANVIFAAYISYERSWHTYWFSAVIVSGRHDCPLVQEHFLWPLLKCNALPCR